MVTKSLWVSLILMICACIFGFVGGYFFLNDNYYMSTYSYIGAGLVLAISYKFRIMYYRSVINEMIKNGNREN